MNNVLYKPEGFLQIRDKNEGISLSALEKAKNTGQILEARAIMCDNDHNLIVDFGEFRGIIPREDAALGIRDGNIKDIAVLSRVNKSICFKVSEILKNNNETYVLLSRLKAQEEALEYMLHYYTPGDVIDAKVTHLEPFGAFADIGCGIIGLISIENISVSRISHPKDRFYAGQNIKVVVKDIDFAQKRFTLSHKELLGTWHENAALFLTGQTVCGTVRSIEEYGIFVELTPNLAGLAEHKDFVEQGQQATVYIKNIIPDKMKIKLSIIDYFCGEKPSCNHKYFITEGHIDTFTYSPPESERKIETFFNSR